MALLGRAIDRDLRVLEKIAPILNDAWRPLRFLADLRTVWPDLGPEQRDAIEVSRPIRDRFHERLARGYLMQLDELTPQIGSAQYRSLRDEMMVFLESWEKQEPDKLKVFSAVIRQALDTH